MSHEEQKELIALDALGALDEAEVRALEAHIAECAECRAEAALSRDAAAALALTVAPVAPAPQLRARILEQVRALQRKDGDETERGQREARHDDVVSTVNEPPVPPSNVIAFTRPDKEPNVVSISKSNYEFLKYASLAASVAALALAISLFIVWNRSRATEQRLAQERATVESLNRQIAEAREARELLAAPQSRAVTLAGMNDTPQARARFVYDQQTGQAMLFVSGLPPAPPGKAYQIWFIAGGTPMPGGVFRADQQGSAMMRDEVPAAGRHAAIFAITLEDDAGARTPSQAMVLRSAT